MLDFACLCGWGGCWRCGSKVRCLYGTLRSGLIGLGSALVRRSWMHACMHTYMIPSTLHTSSISVRGDDFLPCRHTSTLLQPYIHFPSHAWDSPRDPAPGVCLRAKVGSTRKSGREMGPCAGCGSVGELRGRVDAERGMGERAGERGRMFATGRMISSYGVSRDGVGTVW